MFNKNSRIINTFRKVLMLHPVNNTNMTFKSGPWYLNTLTYMTSPDAMGPILGLEVTVDVGRSANAYKRGGKNEMRERLIEDLTGGQYGYTV